VTLENAGPAVPVEILGLNGTPAAGDDFTVLNDENQARQIAEFRQRRERDSKVSANARSTLEQMFAKIQDGEAQELPVVIKADAQGSAEALVGTLEKLATDEVMVNVLHSAVGGINDQQRDFLQVVRSNVERMSALVSDLSDVARIETGRLQLDPLPLPVAGYITQTVETMAADCAAKKQTVEVEVAPGLPEVLADSNRLVQVLGILLRNACNYTPTGGAIRITAHTQPPGFVHIAITDTGVGISPEDQNRLFTQFFRSDDAFVREQQGWGLGLSVAKNLVELMGGELGFQSEYGAGSTFWFTLPEG